MNQRWNVIGVRCGVARAGLAQVQAIERRSGVDDTGAEEGDESLAPAPRKSARTHTRGRQQGGMHAAVNADLSNAADAPGDAVRAPGRKRPRRKAGQDDVNDPDAPRQHAPAPRKRKRNTVAEVQRHEDREEESASRVPSAKPSKHSRTAAFGVKGTRARRSVMTVDIPLSSYSTPTARNRRFLKSASPSGSVSNNLPPSSPLAGQEAASSEPESHDVRSRNARAVAQDGLTPSPPPMFNMNLVQSARARAAREAKRQAQEVDEDVEHPADGESSADDDTGSNYSEGVKEREAKDEKARKNGEEVYHTEDEDAEDEEDFMDAVSKSKKNGAQKAAVALPVDAAAPSAPKAQRGGFAKRAQPAAPTVAARSSASGAQDRSHEQAAADLGDEEDTSIGSGAEDVAEEWEKTPGPLSRVAKDEARELGRRFNDAVTELARRHGKDRRTVMKHTGTTLRATRAANSFCKFSTWYKHKHPMAPSDDPNAPGRYRDEIAAAYHALIDGLSEVERERVLRPKMEWVNDLENGRVEGIDTRRSAASMMNAGVEQLEDLCRVYETHDITILGAIISTARDPAARQMSKVFGTDQAVVELVAANKINLNLLLDRVQNCLICQNYSMEGVELPLPKDWLVNEDQPKGKGKGKAKDVAQEELVSDDQPQSKGKGKSQDVGNGWEQEQDVVERKKRDGLRVGLKQRFLKEIQTVVPWQSTVPWTFWPNFAFTQKVCIRNYPQGVPVIGNGFSYKNLHVRDLEILLSALQKDGDERLHICRWSKEDMRLAEIKAKSLGRVPVVIDIEGRPIRRVIDSGTFVNSQPANAKRTDPDESPDSEASPAPVKKRKAVHRDNDVDVGKASRPVAPLPRRGEDDDSNPAPRKRKRVEQVVSPARQSDSEPSRQVHGHKQTAQRAHGATPALAAAAAPTGVERGRPAPPPHRRGDDAYPRPRKIVVSRDSQARQDSMGPPPAERSRVSAVRTTARMLPGPGVSGRESLEPRGNQPVDGEVRVAGVDLATRRELRRRRIEDLDDLIESYDQPSPPRRAPRVRQQHRQESLGPADSDDDLPEGPGTMRRLGGFTDANGRFSGRREEAGPSSLAGTSRPRSQSRALPPIQEYQRYRRRPGVYVDENIDDDMGLAPDVPHQWNYEYEDDTYPE
ncbi:hypothetical protein PLICRDRAFT_180363 [Plicaturopsis crispa FD-325 SS-3]|uniref:Uncharacterized protein n=1 Tax=Plicaturopsis crispa FD-325 SS-3 TaxID=944288 RepID=A0A0C9T5S3_PLICR|nr:hypothetical protein PLICRDRAFT_180363 [Plicaturopsis crispa FD-325 SS-3]